MARARRPRVPVQASPEAKAPGPSPDPLDEFLPPAEPSGNEVHLGAAVLEVGDPVQLLELAADPALRPYLLCRLSSNVALVDPGRAAELAEALRRRGHTPKTLKP